MKDLEELGRLKDLGLLTDEEFETARQEIFSQRPTANDPADDGDADPEEPERSVEEGEVAAASELDIVSFDDETATESADNWWQASDGLWYPPEALDALKEQGWFQGDDGQWYPPPQTVIEEPVAASLDQASEAGSREEPSPTSGVTAATFVRQDQQESSQERDSSKATLDDSTRQLSNTAKVGEVTTSPRLGPPVAKDSAVAGSLKSGWKWINDWWKGASDNARMYAVAGALISLMMAAGIVYEVVQHRKDVAHQREVDEFLAEYEAEGGLVIREGQKAAIVNGERVAIDEDQYVMPDVTCMNLQTAQDLMQEVSGPLFWANTYEIGGNSLQIWDRNWVIVRQSPAADEIVDWSDDVDFGVIKRARSADLLTYGCG